MILIQFSLQDNVPELDDHTSSHPPQLYFSAQYDEVSYVLKVFIDQAKHLRPNDHASKLLKFPSSSYSILPDVYYKKSLLNCV